MEPVARHGRLPRSRPAAAIARWVATGLAVVLVAAVSVAGIALWQLRANLGEGVDISGGSAPPEVGAIDQPVNILIVGSDSGGGNAGYGERSGARNDVTILLHISPVRKTAIAVSFPRDMFVRVPACPNPDGGEYPAMGTTKINASLGNGLACTVATVEQLTGLEIGYAGVVEFDGVVEMSNAVGGVTVCVASAIHDSHTGLNLEAGEHTLQGAEALAFLRSRYGVGDGSDLTRISNQQLFLSALLRTVKSSDVLGNPITLYALAQAATQNMTLSTSLNRLDTMVSMALALQDIDLDRMVFAQYPTASSGDGVVPRTADAAVLVDAIAQDLPIEVAATGGGAVPDDAGEPAPPAEEPETSGSEPGDGTGGAPTPEPTETADAPVQLPPSITGQAADQRTCTAGQTY